MRFRVRHETIYGYSAPVALGRHLFRLRPRDDGVQSVLSYSLAIEPAPSLVSPSIDAAGNVVTHAWFLGTTEALRVTSAFEVETLRTNPFDYVPDPGFERLPAAYPDASALLALYREDAAATDPAVRELAAAVADAAGGAPLAFLDALNRLIHAAIHREIRDEGAAQSAAFTLQSRRGACRDLTVLFMAACRAVGMAARFVSGYRRGDLARPDRHLHAWPEVFIPGGGWRGWDPVEGLAVADTHVALAAAAAQAETMPVEGTFSGAGANSRLDYRIEIEVD